MYLTKQIPLKVLQYIFLIHAYVKDCIIPNIFLKIWCVMERGSPGGWAWCVGWWVSWLCKVLNTPSPISYSGHITLWPGSILESYVPEHDLSTQEYRTYGEAAWADLGCKYKTSSRYYYTTRTYIYLICKLVSVNSRNVCTYMYMYSCVLLHEFLIVELNLYTCIKVYSFF